MRDTEANTHIFVSLIIFSIVGNLINTLKKEEKASFKIYNFKNYFSEKILPLIENVRIKLLNCCKHHINIIDFVLWRFLPLLISLMSEWNMENTVVFSCKTSAFI